MTPKNVGKESTPVSIYPPYTRGALRSLVSHHEGGGTPSRNVPSYWGGALPWASVKDFSDGRLRLTTTQERITEAGLRACAASLIPSGIPLVCTRMAVGRAAQAAMPTAINQDVKALFPVNGVSADYLIRVLSHIQAKAEAQAIGSTVKGIRIEDLLSIHAPIAPLDAQAEIARVLDTLDIAIRRTEAIIEKLKQVKQGLLRDLLTRGIDQNGELRPPQSEAPHLYKQSPLGWIPKEWTTDTISSLLSDQDPSMRSGPFGSALLKSELVERGIPLLGIDNVHVERFVSEFVRFVSEEKFLQLSRYAVRPKDLMITIMGTVGRCCLVPDDIGRALSSKHTWTISLDSKKYDSYLAMLQVNYSPWVLSHFARDEQGGIMSAIRSETIRSLVLPGPSREEQTEMSRCLVSLDRRMEGEKRRLHKLRLKRAGFSDDLLTGRVRITPLLKE